MAGLLCKETGAGDKIIRLSPPLCITQSELDYAVDAIAYYLL